MIPEVNTRFHANYQSPTRVLGYFVVTALIFQCIAAYPQKVNWFNPCRYARPSRDIRNITNENVKGQLKIIMRSYKKINKTKIYGDNPHLSCDFLVNDENKTDMLRYYAKFWVLGKEAEKLYRNRMKIHDPNFPFEDRKRFLAQVRDGIKTLMCEIYDVLKSRKRFKQKKIRREAQKYQTLVPPKVKNAGLTELIQLDNCLYSTYERLIFSLDKQLKRKSNKRRNRQRKFRHKKL